MYKIIAILFLLFVFATASYSQEESAQTHPGDLENITLDEAISMAISNSIELRKTSVIIRDNETKLAEETVWSWLSPSLSLRGGVDVETGEPRFTLGVSVDLADVMGAGNKRMRTIRFTINEEKKNLEALKVFIHVKITGAYKEYKAAIERLRAMENTLKNDETLLSETRSKGSRTEVLLLRSILNQDRVAVLTARQELERAEMNLREVLGLAPLKGKD